MRRPAQQIADETARAFEVACADARARGMTFDRREALGLACEYIAATEGLEREALLVLVTERLGLPDVCDDCGADSYEREVLTLYSGPNEVATHWRCRQCVERRARVAQLVDGLR